jgi:MFS family permease
VPAQVPRDGVTRRQRLALLAAIMGSFAARLDATAVNVALPAIRSDLGGGLAGQQWVSDAYLLALGSLIKVSGLLPARLRSCGCRKPMPPGDIRGGCRQCGHAAGPGNDPDQ